MCIAIPTYFTYTKPIFYFILFFSSTFVFFGGKKNKQKKQRVERGVGGDAGSRGDPEPAAERDGRVRGERRHRRDGLHQPQGKVLCV